MNAIFSRLPSLGALRAFEAVARLGSLSQAALELNVTKSAISHQLRGLEAELGAPLLRRGGGLPRAEPTDAGFELLRAVQQALALLDGACRDVRATAVNAGQRMLHVSANASLASLWLAPRIGKFSMLHPDIQIRVHLHASQDPDWQAHGIELAIMHMSAGSPHAPAPGDIAFVRESVIPVCSPALVPAAERDDPQIFDRYRLIQEAHVASPETDWRTWRRHVGLRPAPKQDVLTLTGMSTVVGAATGGFGIALGRAPLIDAELASGRLVALMPERRMVGSWRYVMRLRANMHVDAALQALIDFLIDEGR